MEHQQKTNQSNLPTGIVARLLFFMLVSILTSCNKYYTVPEDGLEVHKTFTDDSEVLFTLSAGEIVYTNVELGDWGSVYRKSDKNQNGWIRTHILKRVDEDVEDSLLTEETLERKAKRQAERDRAQYIEDSIRAAMPRAVYFTILADSIEFYSYDMSTKEGRKLGKKVGALEKGRRIYTMNDDQPWMMVYTADDGKNEHGYIENRGLQRLEQAEMDSLNNIRIDSHRGYAFKSYFPVMVIVLVVLSLLAFVPYVMMLRQRKKRHFMNICLTYLCAIIITFFAAARLDGSMNFKWCYNLLPFALCTLLVFPIYYTNISRKGMRRILNATWVLMFPLCFVLFAHHQEGYLWEALKMWALNAVFFWAFVRSRLHLKCPYCGMYGSHIDAGETYGGRQGRASTSTVKHGKKFVGETTEHVGENVTKITKYFEPGYVEETVHSWLVDVFHLNKRCLQCGRTFKDGIREVVIDGTQSSKTTIKVNKLNN